MENITTKLDKIAGEPKELFTQEDKVIIAWDKDPIFLLQEISRELHDLNKKERNIINHLKASTIVLILILLVLVAITVQI